MNELINKELCAQGGRKCRDLYGAQFYSDIGKKGYEGKLKKYGADYYRKLSINGLKGRYKKGLISRESYKRAVEKVNAKYNIPE